VNSVTFGDSSGERICVAMPETPPPPKMPDALSRLSMPPTDSNQLKIVSRAWSVVWLTTSGP
jgi:hypothetical protein